MKAVTQHNVLHKHMNEEEYIRKMLYINALIIWEITFNSNSHISCIWSSGLMHWTETHFYKYQCMGHTVTKYILRLYNYGTNSNPVQAHYRLRRFQEVGAPRFWDNQHMNMVRLSAPRNACRTPLYSKLSITEPRQWSHALTWLLYWQREGYPAHVD